MAGMLLAIAFILFCVGVLALVVVAIALAVRGNKSGYTGPFRKSRADVYTMLLILALIAILLAIVCLYFELDMYNWQHKAASEVRADRAVALATID